jgi:hypothetical protein
MLLLPVPYDVNPEKFAEALGTREIFLAEEERIAAAFPDFEVG